MDPKRCPRVSRGVPGLFGYEANAFGVSRGVPGYFVYDATHFSFDPKQNHCKTIAFSLDPKQNQCKTSAFSLDPTQNLCKTIAFSLVPKRCPGMSQGVPGKFVYVADVF